MELTICSANLRNANADDGNDSWPHRHQLLAHTLNELNADVIGVQEAMQMQVDWLSQSFSTHTITPGLPYGNHAPHEYAAIAWRSGLFTVHQHGGFHLSETPDRPSRSWDTSWMRVATWMHVTHIPSQLQLCLCNTHLDHRGEESRRQAIHVIARQLQQFAHLPTFITGDFNIAPDSDVHAALCGYGFEDSWTAAGNADGAGVMSFHGFKGVEWPALSGERDDNRIDWIVLRDPTQRFHVQHAAIVTSRGADGRFPSDHYPVVATYHIN
jgi:endonuclease/exonuclease/phosphatase family metal-dependent hydrolase